MPNWKKVLVSGSDASLNSLYVTNAVTASIFSGSFTGSLFGTASYATSASQALTSSFITASNVFGPFGSNSIISSSFALDAGLLDGKDSTEFATTGSNTFVGKETISGSIRFAKSNDPDPTGTENTTYLFASASNTSLEQDLYFRQNGNLVKWKWMEGQLSSGLLYGGIVTYSGSFVYISSGSGIIVNYNANTGSEISPIIDYVKWNSITSSITNITSSQVTYLYIDNNGSLVQQQNPFTPQQYQEYIPLGAIGHFDFANAQAFGGLVNTAYGQQSQTSIFIDAFGPLKLNGYILDGQSGSLSLGVGSGTSFIHGGFYAQDQDSPSNITSNAAVTASIVRCYTSGSTTIFDTNAGNLYTTVDPTQYDNAGTLSNVSNNDWTIQRVFSYPVNNTLYVYYGQSVYADFASALDGLASDPFVEGLATQPFTTFVGYLVVKSNAASLTDTDSRIIQAGLYRSTVGGSTGGGATVTTLEDLADVNITSPVTGEALIYNAGIWVNGYPNTASFTPNALTSSYTRNADLLDGYDSAAFTFTSSFNVLSASYNSFTASYNVASASFDTRILANSSSIGILSSSFESFSASFSSGSFNGAFTGSFTGSFIGNGSGIVGVVSSSYAATSSYADNFTVAGTLTAQTINVQVITSSTEYVTGSTIFGSQLSNTHQFTGSVTITGSLAVNDSNVVLTNQTSSMSVLSSSFAISASQAQNAISSSFAITASFALNAGGGGFPYTGSAIITGSLDVTGSIASTTTVAANVFMNPQTINSDINIPAGYNALVFGPVDISGSINVGSGSNLTFLGDLSNLATTGSNVFSGSQVISGSLNVTSGITGSLFGTASFVTTSSFAVTASYTEFAVSASNAPGFTTYMSQSVAATTWSFVHNLDTRNPIVQVYNIDYTQIIPNEIISIDSATTEIRFTYAQAGFAVASNGGGLYITGSTTRLLQSIPSVTWSFNHNLGTKYPGFEVYDSSDNVVIPAGIKALDNYNAEIYFSIPATGIAIANYSGISGSFENAISSSYAVTASYADNFIVKDDLLIGSSLTDYATVASSISGGNNLFTKSTGSYASGFFKYVAIKGAARRAGEIIAVWNTTGTASFTDFTSTDIGDTSVVTASVDIAGSNIEFNIQTNNSGWTLRSVGTFM